MKVRFLFSKSCLVYTTLLQPSKKTKTLLLSGTFCPSWTLYTWPPVPCPGLILQILIQNSLSVLQDISRSNQLCYGPGVDSVSSFLLFVWELWNFRKKAWHRSQFAHLRTVNHVTRIWACVLTHSCFPLHRARGGECPLLPLWVGSLIYLLHMRFESRLSSRL